MNDLRGVYILEASEQLIEEELVVFFGEGLVALDDGGKVGVHHLGNYISTKSVANDTYLQTLPWTSVV